MRSIEIPPQDFRRLAENIIEVASQYLTTLNTRSTFPDTSGTRTEALFHHRLEEKGLGAQAFEALPDVLGHSRAPKRFVTIALMRWVWERKLLKRYTT